MAILAVARRSYIQSMSVTTEDLKEGKINDQLETQLDALSAQVEANVERGRNALAEWQATLSEKSSEFGRTMDRYSHEHPWRMISSALMAGVLLGLLCGWENRR